MSNSNDSNLSTQRSNRLSVKEITISALLIAIAFIFSNFKLFQAPQGGAVTLFSLLLVSVIGYMFGIKVGFISAFAYGILQLVMGGYVVHPIQVLLEYPIACMFLGVSGLFRNKMWGLPVGFVIGCIAKYLCHVIAGVVFFSEAGASIISSLVYSLGYNSFILIDMGISFIFIPILLPIINKLKKTYVVNDVTTAN